MSIKLLPAPVNAVDSSQARNGSTSLVPVTQRAINARAGQIGVVPSADVFSWSSSARRGEAPFINGTLVEDSQSDETGRSAWQYVSGLAWSGLVESTAIVHYLSSAANPASWSGRLIDLYA
jgi:hypothetical protein